VTFGGITASQEIQVVDPLGISQTSLPGGSVNTDYDQTLTATGGTSPYTWSVTYGSLPNGLSLDPSTGEISGELGNEAGCYQFDIGVVDSSWQPISYDQGFQIGVSNGTDNGCLQVTTTSMPNGTVGAPYKTTLAATGGTQPYTWSDEYDELPSWATLDPSTGEISGTPTQANTYCFTAEVTDSSSPQQTASSQGMCWSIAPSS
jgi:hypothetical protein